MVVPSYLPFYYRSYPYAMTVSHQPGLLAWDAGPLQMVRYGRADIRPETVAAAIYGID